MSTWVDRETIHALYNYSDGNLILSVLIDKLKNIFFDVISYNNNNVTYIYSDSYN